MVGDWNPNADNVVFTLAVSGGIVNTGGYFASIGGQGRNHLAALDARTGLVTPWNPDVSWVDFTLAVSGGTVYAGGWFSNAGGQARRGIAALDATTGEVRD